MIHTPVLTKDVLQYLDPKPNENFVDCTVGEGGHTILILEKNGPMGKVIGIDWDPQQIKNSKLKIKGFNNRLVLVNDSYTNLQKIVDGNNLDSVDGILLDLGMSSVQLEDSQRGFSFQRNEQLDMRYDNNLNGLTASIILNDWPEEKIEEILREYGEENFSKKIASKIIEEREKIKIESTFQLAEIVKDATPSAYWRGRIHYATRTFQALRIAVNSELENLKNVLPQAISILSPGGRIAIISFHSLEDRIVKNFFREKEKQGIVKILTKKPITAGAEEITLNPRSRSAKLRAIIKN